MFVSKKLYILAIDGDYIHLMPPEHKGMFDSVKTVSGTFYFQNFELIFSIDFISCECYSKL